METIAVNQSAINMLDENGAPENERRIGELMEKEAEFERELKNQKEYFEKVLSEVAVTGGKKAL